MRELQEYLEELTKVPSIEVADSPEKEAIDDSGDSDSDDEETNLLEKKMEEIVRKMKK